MKSKSSTDRASDEAGTRWLEQQTDQIPFKMKTSVFFLDCEITFELSADVCRLLFIELYFRKVSKTHANYYFFS